MNNPAGASRLDDVGWPWASSRRLKGAPEPLPHDEATRVDVIGIGVQKAATTWLFRCLTEHPDIYGANVAIGLGKELNFFNHNYEKGILWYHSMFAFGDWKNLEYSTLYFHDLDVPSRLYGYNPKAKLLLSLRNPIDRAFSQHKHEIRRLPREFHDFRRALQYNPSYIEQGKYATHLSRWLEYFPITQLHIVDYEEIQRQPAQVLKGIWKFVAVEPGFTPSIVEERVNVSYTRRSRRVDRWITACAKTARRIVGNGLVNLVKARDVSKRLRAYNRVEIDETQVAPLTLADRRFLSEVFAEDRVQLETLWGRDLSHWR